METKQEIMKAWLFLSIRDVSKRRRETTMVIFAITIGVVGPVFTTAINNGMQDAFVGNFVDVVIGHIQLQPNTGETFINKSDSMVEKVRGIPGIIGVAPRIVDGVEFRTKDERGNLNIVGVKPSEEEKASTLASRIERGEYLDDKDKNEILIGTSFADEFKVDVGDKLTIQYRDEPAQQFDIKGVVGTGTWDFDRFTFIAPYKTVQELVHKDEASYILVRLDNPSSSKEYKTLLQEETTLQNVKTWQELSAGLAGTVEVLGTISLMTSIISVFVAAISISLIIYTTVKNKMRQIGVLKAIGARKSMVLKTYLTEALFIGITGTLLGTVFGLFLISMIDRNPIVIEPVVGVKLIIRPWISLLSILSADIAILLTCVFGGIYPAMIAARTNIIKAIWSG
jgi:putative ABC transport system permease protein